MDYDVIAHTGVAHDDNPPGRGSGRWEYGTGENPGQHEFTFKSEVKNLRKQGMKDSEIAKTLLGKKATTTDLKAELSIQTKKEREFNRIRALQLLDECNGNVSEVGRRMGRNESTIRSFLDEAKAENNTRYEKTAEMLKKRIDSCDHPIDVSAHSELYMNVTDSTKKVALSILEKEGYVKTWVKIPQLGTNHETSVMVMAKPGTTYSEIQKDRFNIQPVVDFSPDKGKTWWTPKYPESLSSNRIKVRYSEEGGLAKDGVIEIRPGVKDLSLGNSKYAQVRIAVDGTHYMKGMAMYCDDMPKGYDVIYNTNKKKGTPLIGEEGHEVLKRLKINAETGKVDRDNPFGALIKRGGQHEYIGKDGKKHLSVINKIQDEGDWDTWSKTLASQFLSKQPLKLIEQQISTTLKAKHAELDEINSLTNPAIRKKLLADFSESCDATADGLAVKGFKGQAYQVILPIPKMSEKEIYAPNFNNGETVALIRYPHGGIFEIPILTVNNKVNKDNKFMHNAKDAVGINCKVADRLSGADFDGDTVVVIPMTRNKISIQSHKELPRLKGFEPKDIYKLPDSAPKVTSETKENEMGRVSNLITDMTIAGADFSEIERAVMHSMVVIDSEKHHLDYKQSEKDFGIIELKKKYQGVSEKNGQPKGASTIISKSSSIAYINERKEIVDTKKMTPSELKRYNAGKKVYRDTGKTKMEMIKDPKKMTPEELKVYRAGKKVYRQTDKPKQEKVTKMSMVDDAMELVRDPSNKKEVAYAKYANELKAMADSARRDMRSIKPVPVNQSAKKTYATEVEKLNEDLRIAQMNAPRERMAHAIGNARVSEKFKSNPDMDYEHRQRAKAVALTQARAEVGAGKDKIVISDKEWEAIQAHAISTSKLNEILNNTDMESVKKRAMPKGREKILSASDLNRMYAMLANKNNTVQDVANALGVSVSTIHNYY